MNLNRLAALLGADIRAAPIPCLVAVDGSTISLQDPSNHKALARGLACLILARGGAEHTHTDVTRLSACLERF